MTINDAELGLREDITNLMSAVMMIEVKLNKLEKDSHPPVDIAEVVMEILKEQQIIPQTAKTRISQSRESSDGI